MATPEHPDLRIVLTGADLGSVPRSPGGSSPGAWRSPPKAPTSCPSGPRSWSTWVRATTIASANRRFNAVRVTEAAFGLPTGSAYPIS
ncbi:MAG: hypothetical protein R2715_06030 [Ilumatobacteraceae bacterium]